MLFWQLENYQKELEEMKNMTRQEYVAHLRRYYYYYFGFMLLIKVHAPSCFLIMSLDFILRRKSSGFSRGASMYRGVTRSSQPGFMQYCNFCVNMLNYLLRKMNSFPLKSLFLFSFLADTINMDDGRLGLEGLRETRIFILGHLVSSLES